MSQVASLRDKYPHYSEKQAKLIDGVREVLRTQTPSPVVGKLQLAACRSVPEISWRCGDGEWERGEVEYILRKVVALYEQREKALFCERTDPFRHAYEPPAFDEIDWMICRKRVENPGIVLEILILGGNGSGKSHYSANRLVKCAAENRNWLVWCFSTDEMNSKSVMQQAVYHYLPAELKTNTGKAKRTRDQKIIYTTTGGFTGNVVGMPSGSVIQFRYHSANIATLEGPRPYTAFTDEEVTLEWVEGISNRLHTRAEETKNYKETFQKFLEQKAANPDMKFPREWLTRLFRGVHLITFTPRSGWTNTVQDFTEGATTLKEVVAELLPIRNSEGKITGYEKVPKMQNCRLPNRAVYYLHSYDNIHGGNWEGMKRMAPEKTRENVLWWAYGVCSRVMNVRFPKFSRPTHVRTLNALPKQGTWYHVVDPCPGRNFFMIWAKVNPLGEIFVAREWPMESDYIPGVGYPGVWAESGKKLDGDKGPAQNPFGFGIDSYVADIKRVEHELWKLENPGETDPDAVIKVPDGNRIMDSRAGNTPTLANEAAVTLIEQFADKGLMFVSAGKDSGALDGETRVGQSVELVNDLLWYDSEKTRRDENGAVHFDGRAPRLYVADCCTNTIFTLANWTSCDGQAGSSKDPADCLRYLAMARPTDMSNVQHFSYVRR